MTKRINPYYHLLKTEKESAVSAVLPNKIELKTSREGGEYGMIFLPSFQFRIELAGKIYEIRKPHISIFKDYRSFSRSSTYHMTADLFSAEETSYTLHVYFDEHDQVIQRPVLKAEVGAAGSEDREIEVEDSMLIDLARIHCAPVMRQLRLAQKKCIDALSSRVEAELQAVFSLSQETIPELSQALSITKQLTQATENLQNLGGSDHFHSMLLQYSNNIEWALAEKLQEEALEKELTQVQTNETAVSDAEALEPLALPVTDTPAPIKVSPTKAKRQLELEEQLSELKRQIVLLSQYKARSEPSDMSLGDLLAFKTAAENALVQWLSCPLNAYSNQHLGLINECLSITRVSCVQMLSRALVAGDLPTMEELANFVPYLPENHLLFAIHSNNSKVLEWLLTKGNVLVNQLQLSYQGKPRTLLEIAYLKNSVDCFKVLLAHGASPFILAEDGLPIAHHVSLQRHGPMHGALIEHVVSLNYQSFYKHLATILESYVMRSDLSPVRRDELQRCITDYRLAKNLKLPVSSAGLTHIARSNTSLIEGVHDTFGEDFIHSIETSPEVRAKRDELLALQAEYLKKLSPGEFRKVNKIGQDWIRKIIEFQKKHHYEITTQQVVEGLDNLIKQYQLMLRQRDVVKELNRYAGRQYRKAPREYKALTAENNSLLAEIKRLSLTTEILDDAELTDAIDEIEKMGAQVQQIQTQFSGLFSKVLIEDLDGTFLTLEEVGKKYKSLEEIQEARYRFFSQPKADVPKRAELPKDESSQPSP
ncbi:ankyrin repeat domain-containing protein [Legionella adelaidensis]|nr:ankyrin repeat domain-containing protein [Legionella adelaidensis]